jgi:hypothetical protein
VAVLGCEVALGHGLLLGSVAFQVSQVSPFLFFFLFYFLFSFSIL